MANKKTNTTSVSNQTVETEVKTTTKETKTKKVEPLTDDTEIEVQALIPNVSYYDKTTGDNYRWENCGDTELMTVETLKTMFRNYRGYFTNLWLKPLDDRIVKQYKLERLYQRYEKVLNLSNYSLESIDEIATIIKEMPNSVKIATFNRIQNWVSRGEISNIKLIKKLERKFGLDLIELI